MAESNKTCAYCAETIKQTAKVCKHCDRFQSLWGNWTTYCPHVIAILPFVLAAIVYSAQQGSKLYSSHFGEIRVKPLYYSNSDYSSYLNDGDKDVLVQTMNFRSDDLKHASLVNVYRLVKVGETHVYHPTLPPAEIIYQPCTYVGGSVPIYGLTDQQKQEIFNEIRNGKTLRQLDLDLKYFAPNHQQLNFHSANNSSGELVTVPAKMQLMYSHISGDDVQKEMNECVAVLMATVGDDGTHPYLQRIGRETYSASYPPDGFRPPNSPTTTPDP